MKKKLFSVLLIAVACLFVFAACSTPAPAEESAAPTEDTATEAPAEDTATEAPAEDTATEAPAEESAAPAEESAAPAGDLVIPVLAKGFQHQFWTVVKDGADAAAAEFGATITFEGPPSESDVDVQVNQLNAALAQNPSAICLAALDTESVMDQLNEAMTAGIPVIGFDSGVPDAPEGAIAATASTDNYAAAGIAAEQMMENADFKAAVEGASVDAPIVIGVASQDATSTSVTQRTQGFIDRMKDLVEEIHADGVEVTGHTNYEAPAAGDVVVTIQVSIPPTTSDADLKNAADALLNVSNIEGIFCSNEGAVGGLLNATADGSDLGEGGRYAGLIVAGFDAGKTQKNAVREGWFIGSVTQDPYNIGYQAVNLAVKAANGETVADVDTGAKWYNAENMDDADIINLIYD